MFNAKFMKTLVIIAILSTHAIIVIANTPFLIISHNCAIMYLGDLDSNNKTDKTNQPQTISTPDATLPAQVIVIAVTESDGQVTIDWIDPADADFNHVEITRTLGGTNTVNSGIQSFTANGLTNGTEYQFSLVSVDTSGNQSSAVTVTATPTSAARVVNYCIYTADDLNAVRGGIKTGWDKTQSYIMMADVDLSSYSPWTPIGTSGDAFSGNFNGNGHTITGLSINNPATNYQGLFGYIEGASVVRNLTILNCNITGQQYTGGLVGRFNGNANGANIRQVHVTGTITGTGYIAGLAGSLTFNDQNDKIEQCSAVVTINVPLAATPYNYIGGLVGQFQQGSISESYTAGDFNNTNSSRFVGGIVGSIAHNVENCYSRMNVTGYTYVGGIIGFQGTGNTTKCYATGDIIQGGWNTDYFGGLAGLLIAGGVTDSYYCETLIGTITDNLYGTRRSGLEMRQQSTYVDWDFTSIWNIDGTTNNGFPYLRSNTP